MIIVWHFDTGGPTVNAELNVSEVQIIFDFVMLLNAEVAGIAVDNMIDLPDKIVRLLNVVNIGSCACNGMNIAGTCVNTSMYLHSVIPLIAFFRLMHFRIPLFLFILCRRSRGNDRRIDNRSAIHDKAGCIEPLGDISENLLTQLVFF